jgi:hypothetical protein
MGLDKGVYMQLSQRRYVRCGCGPNLKSTSGIGRRSH